METVDRIEIEEPRVTEAPSCWPHKEKYWVVRGVFKTVTRKGRWPWSKPIETKVKMGWGCLYYSAEDAEAAAATPNEKWTWNGKPAGQISLRDNMREIRQDGRPGIVVKSFCDGKWITVLQYPAGEPLPEDMR